MSIDLQVINQRQNPQVEKFVFDQLGRMASRFENRLASVEVRIQHAGRSKNGGEKRCTIDTNLTALGAIHVSAEDTNVYEAIHKAILRLSTLIGKKTAKLEPSMARRRFARNHPAVQ